MGEDVRERAGAAAGQVSSTTTDQAKAVAGEARQQASGLADEARTQVRDQARAQQQRAAERLHSLADELNAMADKSEQSSMATDLARETSRRTHGVAGWLEEHEPSDLLESVRDFARRRPGIFLAGAALAGVAAGRLTRGMAAAAAGGEGTSGVEARRVRGPAEVAHGVPYGGTTATPRPTPVGTTPGAEPMPPTSDPLAGPPSREPIPGRETP